MARADWRAWSGGDRPDQRFDAEDVDHPLHVVGQHLQAHLRFDLFEGLGQEMGASHPGLEGSEWMFDGLSANGHGVWLASCRGHPRAPSASGACAFQSCIWA